MLVQHLLATKHVLEPELETARRIVYSEVWKELAMSNITYHANRLNLAVQTGEKWRSTLI